MKKSKIGSDYLQQYCCPKNERYQEYKSTRAKSEMNLMLSENIFSEVILEDDVMPSIISNNEHELYYAERVKSAFYYDYKKIFDVVKNETAVEASGCLQVNNLYCERYLSYFLLQNIPYIPLWSKVITSLINIKKRQTNAFVESWFNLVKNHILCGKKKLKCGRFVELTSKQVTSSAKQLELKIPKHHNTRNHHKSNDENDLHLDVNEFWSKKKKSLYF